MTSATDIITYIGIPLAVLGVLPILYTFALSILTQRRIRHLLLLHGHRPQRARNRQDGFLLRASPMTSLIEVEMPRYTIAPVDRADERYWVVAGSGCRGEEDEDGRERNHLLGDESGGGESAGDTRVQRVESTLSMLEQGRVCGFLRGGSWRAFHWRTLVVGRKMYRIQYEDELREPTAEIEFVDLVNFLMDWGAELDDMGWEKLRSGGLWTPSGTVLLRVRHRDRGWSRDGKEGNEVASDGGDWVLRTSMPDDSDGVLTLCVRWPQVQGMRSVRSPTSLPPGWGRLRRPRITHQDIQTENGAKNIISQIDALEQENGCFLDHDGVRFKIENGLISKIYHESKGRDTGLTSDLFHLPGAGMGIEWFTSAAAAVLNIKGTSSKPTTAAPKINTIVTNVNEDINSDTDIDTDNGQLWGFEIPTRISNFIRKDSVPCGVLVLLEILPPSSSPHWTNSERNLRDESIAQAKQHAQRFEARQRAERLEATMPAEQARVHRANREREEIRARHEQAVSFLNANKAREAQRLQDALGSPKMSFKTVAEVCLRWLIEHRVVDEDASLVQVVEAVLYLFVLESHHHHQHSTSSPAPSQPDVIKERESEKAEELQPPSPPSPPSPSLTKTTTTTCQILNVLEEWTAWTHAGGMNHEQFALLASHTAKFCLAACLVALVHDGSHVAGGRKGKASVDMLECLRLWKRIRLG